MIKNVIILAVSTLFSNKFIVQSKIILLGVIIPIVFI
jgi:hypothetical protein